MAASYYWRCLAQAADKEDFLIQPFLENHPGLASLIRGNDAITVRLITEYPPEDVPRCYCGLLEIPNDRTTGHIILPIDLNSGRVAFSLLHRLPENARRDANAMANRMDQYAIPFWEQLKQNAFTAHACFPDVYAIAWDFIITRDGPRMLEGNAGWGTLMPQIFHGGLLAREEV